MYEISCMVLVCLYLQPNDLLTTVRSNDLLGVSTV